MPTRLVVCIIGIVVTVIQILHSTPPTTFRLSLYILSLHMLSLYMFAADAAGKLHVLRHDGDPLGMDGAEVGVLEEAHKVGFGSLLERKDGGGLEAKVGLEVLGDLTDEALERELADEQVGGLLVPADLTESDGSGSVSVGLLHTSGGGGGFAGSLGGELLSGGFASSGLTSGLLGASHFVVLLFCLGWCVCVS